MMRECCGGGDRNVFRSNGRCRNDMRNWLPSHVKKLLHRNDN